MLEHAKAAATWIMQDVSLAKPTLTHTIFSMAELMKACGLELDEQVVFDVTKMLEALNFIVRINKTGPDGDYFNVSAKVFVQLAANRRDRTFVQIFKEPEEGYCLTKTKLRTYRQKCCARDCKYYFAKTKTCVQNKFFF